MKKNKISKILAITLTATMTLAFYGCASNVSKEVETNTNIESEESVNTKTEISIDAETESRLYVEEESIIDNETEESIEIETESSLDIEEETTIDNETETIISNETETIVNSETESDINNETETGITTETQTASAEVSEIEANMIAIATNAFKAMKERNTEDTLKYTNLKEMYCWSNNLVLDDAELYKKIDALMSDPDTILGIVDMYGRMENVKCYNPQLLSEDKIKEYNDYIKSDRFNGYEMVKNSGYNIESAYSVQIEGEKYPVIIMYANGEWKLDLIIDIMYDIDKMVYGAE